MIRSFYNNFIRNNLPGRYIKCKLNGIETYQYFKLLDISQIKPDNPKHEKQFTESIVNVAKENDKVIIVGGGSGSSTIITSRKVGKYGKVITYEGSKQQFEICKKAIQMNFNHNNISVKNKIVGKPIDIWGNTKGVLIKNPEKLEKCDILALDCEGSELNILFNMDIKPKYIIVEIHEFYNPVSVNKILTLLNDYKVIRYERENDNIPILTFEKL